jgi:hypothetical protein
MLVVALTEDRDGAEVAIAPSAEGLQLIASEADKTEEVAGPVETVEAADEVPEVDAEEPPVRVASSPAVLGEAPASSEASESRPAVVEVLQEPDEEEEEQPRLRRGRTWPLRVGFDFEVSVHSITPYAEIYGMHPRFFDFDKGFSMVPAQGFGAARVVPASEPLDRRLIPNSDAKCGEEEDDMSSEGDSSDGEPYTEYIVDIPRAEHFVTAC